ncbi:Cuticular protein analogous to peritrophins 3-A2 [Nesidiocoris tenuis]|uniref:Cuticular protein analogous to peritrophins 3-A2 n=1 Tax=Nesidiocoris tenuis TaxID=355587 RepID=A0ABN7BG07_9HEMI|nr:Cuticular protein analogous to peritrophins 3-A2 [Nesidiocoris tenuis]
MRFAAAIFGFGLVAVAVADDFQCNGVEDYLYPDSSNCRYYHICKKGSNKSSEDACFIFFRRFNPEKLRCDWCWNVDCSAKPPPPPTPSSPTTPPPTTPPPTTPPPTTPPPTTPSSLP